MKTMFAGFLSVAVVVGVVLTLTFSATPAMGDATWTGLGGDGLWSNMLNWKLADGATWASGDPTVIGGGNFLLNDDSPGYDTTTSIVNLDTLPQRSTSRWTLAESRLSPLGSMAWGGVLGR